MAGSALIDTTNRVLGWSTNDFSLYGGQAAVTIGAPAAPGHAADGLSVPDPASSGARSGQSEGPPAREEAPQAAGEQQGVAPSDFHFTPFVPAPIQFGDPAHAQTLEAQIPAATGSGASTFSAVDAIHAPAIVPTAMPSGLAPPTLAVEQPDTAAPALASFGGLAAPVLALHEAVGDTLSTVDNSLSTIVTTADTLLDTTQQALDALPLVSDFTGVEPLLDGVQQTLEALPLVSDIPAADTLADNAHQAVDALPQVAEIVAADDFLGSDPMGGVATLVSMVDSTDAFDLSHVGVDVPDVAASSSILETLADEPAGALLGDAEHAVDTVLPDHSHDGVLGL